MKIPVKRKKIENINKETVSGNVSPGSKSGTSKSEVELVHTYSPGPAQRIDGAHQDAGRGSFGDYGQPQINDKEPTVTKSTESKQSSVFKGDLAQPSETNIKIIIADDRLTHLEEDSGIVIGEQSLVRDSKTKSPTTTGKAQNMSILDQIVTVDNQDEKVPVEGNSKTK